MKVKCKYKGCNREFYSRSFWALESNQSDFCKTHKEQRNVVLPPVMRSLPSEEFLARQIHGVYCRYHKEIRGEDYWTKGNYDLLDEKTKEADRYMARFILGILIARQ